MLFADDVAIYLKSKSTKRGIKILENMAVYTDDSKIKGAKSVGSMYYCPNLNAQMKIPINPEASVYTVEIIALDSATDLALLNSNQTMFIFFWLCQRPTISKLP